MFNTYAEYTNEDLGAHSMRAWGLMRNMVRIMALPPDRQSFPKYHSLTATTGTKTNSDSKSEIKLRGLFYRLNYSYKERYLFEANGRYDGTSRFPRASRFGFFPSFSVGWRISEEPFMAGTKEWLDNLKLRASYGMLGNQSVDRITLIFQPCVRINFRLM